MPTELYGISIEIILRDAYENSLHRIAKLKVEVRDLKIALEDAKRVATATPSARRGQGR